MHHLPQSIYKYILQHSMRGQIIVVLLTLALLPLTPVPLELQRRILDEAIANRDADLLWQLAGFYVAALLGAAGLKFAMNIQREFIAAGIVHSLRSSLYHCIYTITPPSKLDKTGDDQVDEGAVVSMLTNEVQKLGGFAGSAFSGPLLQIGTVVVVLGYMFWVEPLVAAIALALYSPQFVIVPLAQMRLNNITRSTALTVRDLGGFIVDNAEDSLLGREPPPTYLELIGRILGLRKQFVLTKNVMKSVNNVLIALGPFGVIVYGGYLVILGETQVGIILAFVSGLERLGGPIRELIGLYSEVAFARMRYDMLLEATEKRDVLGPNTLDKM
jgi:ABC-type bacteriocin/lantibiotic exporter with double-glycine peptidase domain